MSVVPGFHRITVASTGFLPYEQRLEITRDQAIPVTLTPDPTGVSTWKRRAVTGSLLGVSAFSAMGGGWALNGRSVTRTNRAKAGPGQDAFYEKHERRFTQSAAAGFTIAAVAGGIGGYRLFRDSSSGRVAVTVVPSRGSVEVLFSGRFGGPRAD